MGASGAQNAAPTAPFPRRAREIPPKAGISRVYIYKRCVFMYEFFYSDICYVAITIFCLILHNKSIIH